MILVCLVLLDDDDIPELPVEVVNLMLLRV